MRRKSESGHAPPWVADIDGDGVQDLRVGQFGGGALWIFHNQGTPKAYAFAKETKLVADGKPVHVENRAGPCVADWNSDGDLDLLVGANDGSISLYRDAGSPTSPKLVGLVEILPRGKVAGMVNGTKEALRGGRSKICVVD